MSKREMEHDLSVIRAMVDDLFTIILTSIAGIRAQLSCHRDMIKLLEKRIDRIEQEVFDEY